MANDMTTEQLHEHYVQAATSAEELIKNNSSVVPGKYSEHILEECRLLREPKFANDSKDGHPQHIISNLPKAFHSYTNQRKALYVSLWLSRIHLIIQSQTHTIGPELPESVPELSVSRLY